MTELRVTKGNPDEHELAALVAVLHLVLARKAAPTPDEQALRSGRAAWRRPERAPMFAGARSWSAWWSTP